MSRDALQRVPGMTRKLARKPIEPRLSSMRSACCRRPKVPTGVPAPTDVIRRVGLTDTANPQTTSGVLVSRTTTFHFERAEKLLSILQVKVLPQELIRCL